MKYRDEWKGREALITIILIALFLSGCDSFGSTPGYREKYPDLLEDSRHFYRDPLWLRKVHHCERGRDRD